MDSEEIRRRRLYNQRLVGKPFEDPADVVKWLGAVQAQDYPAAKWGVGLRMKDACEELIEDAVNKGKILRTHVMRPTWHFVLPEDIRWMLRLTAPQVRKLMKPYDRKLELDEELLEKSWKIFAKALDGGNYLTRTELADCLEKEGILARGQRLGHLVMHAELEALICSGPKKGKQMSYALVDERASKPRKVDDNDALQILATRYFQSHGPAQIKDFAWWSGLKMAEARRAWEMIKDTLMMEVIDGKEYWFKESILRYRPVSQAFLLSIYDEYTIGYTDRSDMGEAGDANRMLAMGNALTAVLVLHGKIEGTWRRDLKKNTAEMELTTFRFLSKDDQKLVEKAAARYGQFWGYDVKLV